MEKPKCKDCPNRYVVEGSNCHATCESYIAWSKRHRDELDRIYKMKELDRNLSEVTRGKVDRNYKKYK